MICDLPTERKQPNVSHRAQAGGKLGAEFRRVVRSLAKLEHPDAADDSSIGDWGYGEGTSGRFPWRTCLRKVFDR